MDSLDTLVLSLDSPDFSQEQCERVRAYEHQFMVSSKSAIAPAELPDVDHRWQPDDASEPGLQLRLIAALAGVRQGRPLSCDDDFGDVSGLKFTASCDLRKASCRKPTSAANLSSEIHRKQQAMPDPWLAAASFAKHRRAAADKYRCESRRGRQY
jgi:hypothetical protein